MFSNLISTIAVSAIMQTIIYIIAPESHIRGMLLVGTNIIFMSAIFTQILNLISQII